MVTYQVTQNAEKDWVQPMLIPYIFFFSTACLASLFSLGIKLQMLYSSIRKRHRRKSSDKEHALEVKWNESRSKLKRLLGT